MTKKWIQTREWQLIDKKLNSKRSTINYRSVQKKTRQYKSDQRLKQITKIVLNPQKLKKWQNKLELVFEKSNISFDKRQALIKFKQMTQEIESLQ